MAVCLAIVNKTDKPLYFAVCEREKYREFDILMFAYCSLDIVDEKMDASNRSPELYLGPLISDERFKSYGYLTNTNVKILVVTEIGTMELKVEDIRALLKRLHLAYCNSLSNMFYEAGQLIKSRFLDEAAEEIFSTYV